MTTATFSHVSHRSAVRTERSVAPRPSMVTVLGNALAAARAVRTTSARGSVDVAARFAAGL